MNLTNFFNSIAEVNSSSAVPPYETLPSRKRVMKKNLRNKSAIPPEEKKVPPEKVISPKEKLPPEASPPEEEVPPEEEITVEKIYEVHRLKKILDSLNSLSDLVQGFSDPKFDPLKKVLLQSIDLFKDTLIPNLDLYLNQDNTVIDKYESLLKDLTARAVEIQRSVEQAEKKGEK